MMAPKPVVLIGAAKAGTTSLAQALCMHPEIAELAIKEPGYYCTDVRTSDFSQDYRKLLSFDETRYFNSSALTPRHIAFVSLKENYTRLITEAIEACPKARYYLDASTAYLYSQTAAAQLHAAEPEAKIIAVLRNPVSRAYSHYNMARKYGLERRSALEAFSQESKLERARWGIDECYLELGNYSEQLQPYLELFDRSQLLLLFHEDLKARPDEVLQHVADFLGLPAFVHSVPENENKAAIPKSGAAAVFASAFKGGIRDKIPSGMKRFGKRILFSEPDSLDKDARTVLVRYFAAEIQRLEELLEIDLSHWK